MGEDHDGDAEKLAFGRAGMAAGAVFPGHGLEGGGAAAHPAQGGDHRGAARQLFRWPLGNFMRQMGGVEVNREAGGNYVQAMIDEFNRRDDFLLTIAPEGTRKSVGQWKTGFYHIALGAKVPLIIGMMDYAKKTGGLGVAFMPTGDYAADMARVEEFYQSTTPKHPDKAMKSILAASVQPFDRAA